MTRTPRRVAILGATGHVGMCLTSALHGDGDYELVAVARDAARVEAFLGRLPGGETVSRCLLEDFAKGQFDVVVNCLGVGDPAMVAALGESIFSLTEQMDAIALDYLRGHPETTCVSISSGAAYCGDFALPASELTAAAVNINAIAPRDYYGVAKLASEVRHRALSDFRIVDLRLFGLFSRFADLGARFFMSDVCQALITREVLEVASDDIVRDYVDPGDFAALLSAVIESDAQNDVYDVYSADPVRKSAVLDAFSARYGLRYAVAESHGPVGATGLKPNYYSDNHRAATLGYEPRWTSLECLTKETDALLGAIGRSPSGQ